MNISLFTDLRFTSSATPTGVGKHINQMAYGLGKANGYGLSVLAAKDQLTASGEVPEGNVLASLPASRLPFSWKVAEAIWTLSGGPCVDKYCDGADWVYCPKNDFISLSKKKMAVTIHGAPELDPDMPQSIDIKSRLNRLRRRLSYRRIVERADLLLPVSEFLKRQMMDWFGADESKMVVVGNGVEDVFFQFAGLPVSEESKGRPPYLLCVGGLNTIDGGNEIIQAAKLFQTALPDAQFLVAGYQHDPLLLQAAKGLPNIKLLGYVESAKLAVLMHEALALFFLTRYETFGIAAAESMAVGTPVLTAGGTAVPEVVGDAGLYVLRDPHDVLEKVRALLDDPGLREGLINAGFQRAAQYTWKASVERLLAALEARS